MKMYIIDGKTKNELKSFKALEVDPFLKELKDNIIIEYRKNTGNDPSERQLNQYYDEAVDELNKKHLTYVNGLIFEVIY